MSGCFCPGGDDPRVLTQLIARMEKASRDLAFEEAACIRDQIRCGTPGQKTVFVLNAGDDPT